MKAKFNPVQFSKKSWPLAIQLLDNDGTIIGEATYVKRDLTHIWYTWKGRTFMLPHKIGA